MDIEADSRKPKAVCEAECWRTGHSRGVIQWIVVRREGTHVQAGGERDGASQLGEDGGSGEGHGK